MPKLKIAISAIGARIAAPIIAMQRPVGELVERRVDRDRNQIARQEPPQVKVEVASGLARLALGELVGDRGKDRERRAMHDRGAEAANEPGAGAVIGEEDAGR